MFAPELLRSGTWDPFARVSQIQKQIDAIFDNSHARAGRSLIPPVNIWASEDSITLVAQIPGIAPDDLNVSVNGKIVTLEGDRREETPDQVSTPIHRERWFGKFSRRVELPFHVDADKTRATSRHGILTVELFRAESDKPRRIQITAEGNGGTR